MTEFSKALLPNGLQDLLFPEAEKEAKAVNDLMKVFKSFGYQRVKPPLVEFEESLLSGPGAALAQKTFRLMDPVSQRMMGIRADATPQIARIAQSRLEGEDRPLRFAYAADVLRVNGSQLRPERQFCQVGCELIGNSHAPADVEIILIMVKSLYDLGIRDITIDLTIPSLVHQVFEAHQLEEDKREIYYEILSRRDLDALNPMEDEIQQVLYQLLSSVGASEAGLETLKSIPFPVELAEQILQLEAVCGQLGEAFSVYGLDQCLTLIDPVEHKGFEYHTGISFTLFAKGLRGELGAGGRYQSGSETATGFTIYMDTVLRALKTDPPENVKYVKSETPWQHIKNDQDQGIVVVRKSPE